MCAVHLFLVTVVGACSAQSVHQQGPNSPSRVHRNRGVLAILSCRVRARCSSWLKPTGYKSLRALPATCPARRLASFDGHGLTKSFAENTITVEHQPGGVR